jgi:hypothetical protein
MDPISATCVFATLVQLLAIFKNEKSGHPAPDSDEFLQWLDTHRHQEIKDQIAQSFHLTAEINAILHADNSVILAAINKMDSTLMEIASRMEGLSGLARHFSLNPCLSTQAITFLQSLCSSDAVAISLINNENGFQMGLVPKGNIIPISEPRLVEDDLKTLIEIGLLSYCAGPHGTDYYGITRNAIEFLKTIDEKKVKES